MKYVFMNFTYFNMGGIGKQHGQTKNACQMSWQKFKEVQFYVFLFPSFNFYRLLSN